MYKYKYVCIKCIPHFTFSIFLFISIYAFISEGLQAHHFVTRADFFMNLDTFTSIGAARVS